MFAVSEIYGKPKHRPHGGPLSIVFFTYCHIYCRILVSGKFGSLTGCWACALVAPARSGRTAGSWGVASGIRKGSFEPSSRKKSNEYNLQRQTAEASIHQRVNTFSFFVYSFLHSGQVEFDNKWCIQWYRNGHSLCLGLLYDLCFFELIMNISFWEFQSWGAVWTWLGSYDLCQESYTEYSGSCTVSPKLTVHSLEVKLAEQTLQSFRLAEQTLLSISIVDLRHCGRRWRMNGKGQSCLVPDC